MVRYTILTGYVLFLLVYAWKDWYKSLCGMILLMAVMERPDMPHGMFNIPGLNPFNVLLANVVLAWLAQRRRERLVWDMPWYVNLQLTLFLGVILVGFGRMFMNRQGIYGVPNTSLISEYMVNTIKYAIPGLLVFDGCRSRERFNWALVATLGIYVLIALQAARHIMPTVDADELERRSLSILDKLVGYHRVDVSTMLAGASWAIFAARHLVQGRTRRLAVMALAFVVLYGQALTAGRAGYGTWVALALILCTLRWRSYLLLAPVLILVITIAVPGVVERALTGLVQEDQMAGEESIDAAKLTAGRTLVWPRVIDKIRNKPLIGYGRLAMRRTGLTKWAEEVLSDDFGHPHNAYLEMLLDNGVIGFMIVMPFYFIAVYHSLRLFLDSRSPVFIAIGGAAAALVLGLMGGALTSQTFYPRQSTVGLWCAVGLLYRVLNERSRALALARRSRVPQTSSSSPGVLQPEWAAEPEPVAARTTGWSARPPIAARASIDSLLWARSA